MFIVHEGTEGGKNNCADDAMSERCDGSMRRVVDERHEKGTFGFLCPAEEAT